MKTAIAVLLSLGFILGAVTGCSKKSDGNAETGQANQFTKSYKIDGKTFVANLRRISPPKPGEPLQSLILRFFVENGVAMEPPSAVILDEIGNRLLVRATEQDREKIQALFERIEKGQ